MKIKNIFLYSFILIFIYWIIPPFATAAYVLPYPSTMPGTPLYKVHQIQEFLEQFWYFGNFGKMEYNMKESDKYLVEAKTLFEYQQYLLGYNALQKSNTYFKKIYPFLQKAKGEGKDISVKNALFKQEALKHEEVLQKMLIETPPTFYWNPEKGSPTNLPLRMFIQNSINIRTVILVSRINEMHPGSN